MSQLREDIIAVKDLLSDPDRWVKDTDAQTSDGRDVEPWEPGAVCFCLRGAALKVTGATGWTEEELGPRYQAVMAHLENHVDQDIDYVDYVTGFNDDDDRTHPQIIEALDNAIKGAA